MYTNYWQKKKGIVSRQSPKVHDKTISYEKIHNKAMLQMYTKYWQKEKGYVLRKNSPSMSGMMPLLSTSKVSLLQM